MKSNLLRIFTALGLLICSTLASADISLMAARVSAHDVMATADFYKQAFGLREVNRIQTGGGNVEIMLNFGADDDKARMNSNAQVVIMHREEGAEPEAVPHLVFGVTDMEKAAAAVKAAGGKTVREPFSFGNSGMKIGFFLDNAGNQFELIQQP